MKRRGAQEGPSAGSVVRRPPRGIEEQDAAAASVDDASLRAVARALLALAEELIEQEREQG